MAEKKYHYLLLFLLLILVCYTGSFLYLRKLEISGDNDRWAVFFYDKHYVRQYALNRPAVLLLKAAVHQHDYSYYGKYKGVTGDSWFCVYRKPTAWIYRIFRLAEAVEIQVRLHRLPD